MNRRLYRLAFLVLLTRLIIGEGYAQTAAQGTGLEVDNYQSITVLVEEIGKDAAQIGLTKETLQTRVEERLRKAELKPVKAGEPGDRHDAVLYLNVNVVGQAFNLEVSFYRKVSYATGMGTRGVEAKTWTTGRTGTHNNDATFIMQALDELLDKFVNEYLKANG